MRDPKALINNKKKNRRRMNRKVWKKNKKDDKSKIKVDKPQTSGHDNRNKTRNYRKSRSRKKGKRSICCQQITLIWIVLEEY